MDGCGLQRRQLAPGSRDLVDCPRESMWSTGLLVQKEATCSAQFTPHTAGCWLSKIAVIPLAQRRSRGHRRRSRRRCGLAEARTPRSLACRTRYNINAYNVNLLVTGPDNMRLEVEADDLGGGGAGWRQLRYFVLALPPTGPMTMTLEWPGRRSISVSVPLDSRAVLAAASKARYLWPEAN